MDDDVVVVVVVVVDDDDDGTRPPRAFLSATREHTSERECIYTYI
tara:strand:- start:40 stop:174 length:135 start_codon:yes stop_codon:yes gene_type:complete